VTEKKWFGGIHSEFIVTIDAFTNLIESFTWIASPTTPKSPLTSISHFPSLPLLLNSAHSFFFASSQTSSHLVHLIHIHLLTSCITNFITYNHSHNGISFGFPLDVSSATGDRKDLVPRHDPDCKRCCWRHRDCSPVRPQKPPR
jgi:hypothetical protein